jgi:hypothetical protein
MNPPFQLDVLQINIRLVYLIYQLVHLQLVMLINYSFKSPKYKVKSYKMKCLKTFITHHEIYLIAQS